MTASFESARRGVALMIVCSIMVLVALAAGSALAQEQPATEPVPLDAVTAQGTTTTAGGSVRPPDDAVTNAPAAPGETRERDFLPSDHEQQMEALRAQGINSDSTLWGEVRAGESFTTQASNPNSAFLVQDGGVAWGLARSAKGLLLEYGNLAMIGIIALLFAFYMLRGRVAIDHGKSGLLIERFKPAERFGHWLLATSFILLALTGLNLLYGRDLLLPLIGKETYAFLSLGGKWIHNYVSWAFMIALVWIFVFWVAHNLPSKYDIGWLLRGGGLFVKGSHPPSRKFNAGQKLIFWGTILLGASISASGLMLLFPYELPMFAGTFQTLKDWGVDQWGIWSTLGITLNLPTELTPIQEMQYATMWHAIVAYAMITMIVAHIYIGSVGMEGAFDAMWSGYVDRNWAEEHHPIWVEEADARAAARQVPRGSSAATPAE